LPSGQAAPLALWLFITNVRHRMSHIDFFFSVLVDKLSGIDIFEYNFRMDAYEHSEHELSFEYNQITDQIFLGSNLCCQGHFDQELLKQGITADISLEGERVDAPFGVEFFVWIPVENHHAPTNEQLEFGISALSKMVEMGKKVYVHCKYGYGRSPTLIIAYFISLGYSVSDAIAHVKSKRPTTHLSEVQVEALEEFRKSRSPEFDEGRL